ncbi:MAG: ATP-binding cassette, subfamily bacterial [Frankiaceae bacterium]|jgi:ATP-binding cassette subfamily B protein|nr:ATP-binding cassette, subfamily bacterial [Frankiaceae bacterium]
MPSARRFHSLWRVRTYVRPYLGQMVLMLATAFVGIGAGILIPLVTRAVIDGPVRHGPHSRLLPLGLLALALGVVEGFMAFVRRWVQSYAALGIETSIRDELYAHLQRLSVSFHDRWQSGQLLSRATTDLGVLRRFLGFGLVFLVINVATFVTIVILLLQLYAPLGLVVLASAVPIMWLSAAFEREYAQVARRVQDQQGDLTTHIEEAATGIRVIKAFGRRRLVLARFEEGAERLYGSAMASVRLRAKFWSLLDVIPNVTLAVVLLFGALAVGRGQLTLGGLIAFMSLMLYLVWPIEALGWILATAQEAATAADRLYEVFDTEPSIVDRPGAVALADPRGRLRFEGVTFAYPGSAEPVLRDVWLDIAPGETVALVGVTGSGKTTLAALVPRLYDVTGGRITLDGVDVRDVRLTSLRRVVATAFEEPILFSASVRENLLLGTPDATEAEVDAALALAQAEFVRDLPFGLDTRVGEQGLSLSGGQRQRLALARAVVGRPRVLVLDDPLSALDVHTEALVEEALGRVLRGTTGLVVVHRPSTLALADRVALLEDGTITAVGTHAELMESHPSYRAILSAESEPVAS